MIPSLRVTEAPIRSGVRDEGRVVAELGAEAFVRQFDTITGRAREANLAGVAVRADGHDLNGLARRLRRGDHRLRRKVEGDAENVGILHVEAAVVVQVIGLPAQGAANHLLAQQLGAEGANAENVRDGVGIPALGQHGNGDDATDRSAKPTGLAYGVHDLAQQVVVREVLGLPAVARAGDDLTAEALDLAGGQVPEVLVQTLPGFELFAVDEQRARAAERRAVLMVVAEQR